MFSREWLILTKKTAPKHSYMAYILKCSNKNVRQRLKLSACSFIYVNNCGLENPAAEILLFLWKNCSSCLIFNQTPDFG